MRGTGRWIVGLGLAAWLALASPAGAGEPFERVDLTGLGYTLTGSPKDAIRFTPNTMLVPTPWGTFDVSLVWRPFDQSLRLPLLPAPEPSQATTGLQPFVSAGSRKASAADDLADVSRGGVGDERRSPTAITAGAGLVWRLDQNVELFGEYQFMRLRPELDSRAYTLGGVRTEFDPSGFSWGISVKY